MKFSIGVSSEQLVNFFVLGVFKGRYLLLLPTSCPLQPQSGLDHTILQPTVAFECYAALASPPAPCRRHGWMTTTTTTPAGQRVEYAREPDSGGNCPPSLLAGRVRSAPAIHSSADPGWQSVFARQARIRRRRSTRVEPLAELHTTCRPQSRRGLVWAFVRAISLVTSGRCRCRSSNRPEISANYV